MKEYAEQGYVYAVSEKLGYGEWGVMEEVQIEAENSLFPKESTGYQTVAREDKSLCGGGLNYYGIVSMTKVL